MRAFYDTLLQLSFVTTNGWSTLHIRVYGLLLTLSSWYDVFCLLTSLFHDEKTGQVLHFRLKVLRIIAFTIAHNPVSLTQFSDPFHSTNHAHLPFYSYRLVFVFE
jgi:hypothetical protein